jgi:hypothetical protein
MSRDLNLDRLGEALTEAVTAARGGSPPPMGEYWEFPRAGWSDFQHALARKLGPGSGVISLPAPSRDGVLPVVINGSVYGASIALGVRNGIEVYDVRTLGTF